MQITGRIIEKGKTVGFLINAEGLTVPYPIKGLYNEMIIDELTKAGYKYIDYNPEHIEDPSGKPIYEMQNTVEKDELDPMEFAMNSKRAAANMLSDAEACKYYTRKTNKAVVSMKTMPSYEINTREELEAYIELATQAMTEFPRLSLVKPLNAIVNPDAWFTPHEVFGKETNLYQKALALSKFADYEHYQETCDWLAEQGVMPAGDYSPESFLQGWYSFGPTLLKGTVEDFTIRRDVDGSFEDDRLAASDGSTAYYNRTSQLGVYNFNTGVISTPNAQWDISSVFSMDNVPRERFYIEQSNLVSLKGYVPTDKDGDFTICTQLHEALVTTRVYFTIEHDGSTFMFKGDAYRWGGTLNRGTFKTFARNIFAIRTLLLANMINIDVCRSNNDYKKRLVAEMYAVSNMNERRVRPIFSSNIEYLKSAGVSTAGIVSEYVKWYNNHSKEIALYHTNDPYGEYTNALYYYCTPIPQLVIEAYGLKDNVPETKQEFLEVANVENLLANRQKMRDGKITPSDPEWDNTFVMGKESFKTCVDAVQYYDCISRVSDILAGFARMKAIQEGLDEDGRSKINTAVNVLSALVTGVHGLDATPEQAVEVLSKMDEYINPRKIFRVRDVTAQGAVRDYASMMNSRFSEDTYEWVYINRVYRELSNKPVDKQLPYLMEMIVFKNDKTGAPYRKKFTELVKEQLEGKVLVPDINYVYPFQEYGGTCPTPEALTSCFAGYFAAQLMFSVYVKLLQKAISPDEDYEQTVKLAEFDDITFTVPSELLRFMTTADLASHKQYITLFDYCQWEFDVNTKDGYYRFAAVNADVDLWSVKAKPGYKIPSYALMVNYQPSNVLDRTIGDGFYLQAREEKCIVTPPLRDILDIRESSADIFMPCDRSMALDYEEMISDKPEYEEFEGILGDAYVYESVKNYVKRWAAAQRAAKAEGKMLLAIPLKQSILYSEVVAAMENAEDICTSVETVERGTIVPSTYITSYDKVVSQYDPSVKALTMETAVISKATVNSFENIDPDEALKVVDLKPCNAIAMRHSVYCDGATIKLSDWVNTEHAVRLNENLYITRFGNGYYVINTKNN